MEEKTLNEKESLELITSMINKARNRYSENGFLYLLWGWVVLLCCLLQFVTVHLMHFEKGYYVWLITWVLIIYQTIYLRKQKKKALAPAYTEEVTAYIWIGFVIALFVSIFVAAQYGYMNMNESIILILYGIPTFISGGLLKFRPLVIGGVFCWLLAIASPFVSVEYRVLLLAAAICAAWILPGYLLRFRFKAERHDLRAEIRAI